MSYRIYYVAPEGEGTGEIESLSSYLVRLANAHGVPLSRFFFFTEPQARRQQLLRGILAGSMDIYNRPNQTAEHMIDWLATHGPISEDRLRRLSFAGLMPGIRRDTKGVKTLLRWCPLCFAEAEAADSPPYLRLAWSPKVVTFCPVHRLLLIDRCVECGARQRVARVPLEFRRCSDCQKPLSIIPVHDVLSCTPDHATCDLLALIEYLATTPGRPRANAMQTFVEKVERERRQRAGDVSEPEIDSDRVARISRGRIRPTLAQLRQVARGYNVSIGEILDGEPKQRPLALPTAERPTPVERVNRLDHEYVRERMNEYLRVMPSMKGSLKEAARYIGVSTKSISRVAPEAAQAIRVYRAGGRDAQRERKQRTIAHLLSVLAGRSKP